MERSKGALCLKLFLKFLKIGAFTFGGGYAMIPLIRREIALREGWIEDKDILDILAVSESTPGPIAVNTATFVGYRVAGPLGAACAIVLGAGTRLEIMGGSFLMGMAALALVLLLVGVARLERTGSYILAGVIVSSLAEAGLMTLKVMADPERELAAIEVWTMGSLSAMTADKLPLPAAAVVLCTVALLLLRRPILMLSLGDEQARSLGLDPVFWRGVLLTLTTLMVAAVVSVLGAVAFVGLIAPHIARLLLGRRGGPYLPLCGLVGGAVLLCADLPARVYTLPLSIFTVLLAVPVLAALLWRRKEGTYGDDA